MQPIQSTWSVFNACYYNDDFVLASKIWFYFNEYVSIHFLNLS